MRIVLLGKRWELKFVPRLKDWGDCDPPDSPNKAIRISLEGNGLRQLDTLVHEMLHACEWSKDEDAWIQPVATDIARVLWRLGYRRQDG